jgi:pectate lyase
MVLVLLLFCISKIYAAPCGDVNTSGGIDIVDALLIAQYYVGLNPTNFDQSAADVNGDGSINIVDALLLAQYYVGLIASLPGCDQTPVPTDVPTTVTLQAEDADYDNAEVETEHSGYTGSGYVNTANEAGPYIEWSFSASTGGNAECVFTYANGGDNSRQMELGVNGSTVISSLDFPVTGAWDSWSNVSATISLNSGTNTVRLTSLSSEGAPNLDKLEINFGGIIGTPEPTATPTPTPTADPNVTPQPEPGSGAYDNVIGWGRNTTGGRGGQTINVSGYSELEAAADSSGSAIIVIQNNISHGEGMMDVQGNKTIRGAGGGVSLDFGFYLRGSNVIIQNLDMMNGGYNTGDSEGLDCVTWASDLQNVWIDHCTFHEAMDGLVDPTRNARYVTISFCRFYHQNTAILIGGSDGDSDAENAQSGSNMNNWHYTVTIHHCWFDDVRERSPRVRYGPVHTFNNYIANCPGYAVGIGVGANIHSENNYYYNTNEVWHKWDSSSKPGYVVDVGSIFEGDNGDISTFPPPSGWAWHPSSYYSYTPHSAEWVRDNVQNYAGTGKGNP